MKLIIPCWLCVIFCFVTLSVGQVYAFSEETIHFNYNGRIFSYTISNNIKSSKQFDLNYEINKYNRFGSAEERIRLLKHMISIGIDKEIAIEYLFPNFIKKINSIEKNLHVSAKNASYKINSNSDKVFQISHEREGIDLDRQRLIDNVCGNFISQKPMNFDLPIKKTAPKVVKTDLEKFSNLRSDFSTDISTSSSDRKHNIKNALASLNKVEIAPNEVFSFNKIVGRRTAENGYRQAKIIVNNEFVDGIGGGVCQVSTTLYNSALLAGLEIVEANKHSKQVAYVQAGFDAMVNFGSSDLKFRNNTSEKLTIITNYTNQKARIRIFGEDKSNVRYKLSNEIFNIIEPNEEVFVDEKLEHLDKVVYEDEYFYLKKSSKGMEIKTYREKYENNTLVAKELIRYDKYKVQNAIKIFGTKKRNEMLFVA